MTRTFKVGRGTLVVLRYVLLAITLLWAFFPTLFLVASSFKSPDDIWTYPPRLFAPFTLQNYLDLPERSPDFFRTLLNSAITTVLGVIATLLVAVGAAYVFSRMRMGWLKLPALLLVTVRMFPPIVVIIPLYPTFTALGIIDTVTPLVLAGVAFSVSISVLLMKAFIDSVPPELEEAAMIDGCSRLGAFLRITLRMITPGIAAIVAFVGIAIWNEYLFPLVFTSQVARTAPVTIAVMLTNPDGGFNWAMVFAMASLHMAPMIVLILLLHGPLVKGMTIGAVKG